MRNRIPMEVAASDLLLQAVFALPRFALLGSDGYSATCERIYRELSGFGIRAQQMEFKSARAGEEPLLKVPLFDFSSEVRVGLRFLEVQVLGAKRAERHRLSELSAACERGLTDGSSEGLWASVSLDVRIHCRGPSAPAEIISPFISHAPESLGEALGSGVSFYFSPPPTSEPEIGTATLVLEPSAIVANALFLRVQMTAGTVRRLSSLEASTERYLARCLEEAGVGLPAEWS